MAKIHLLSPLLYNTIAAGEVIEKPIGAVKELVENSIDACANKIVVEVKSGGLDLITITDNGFGMEEDDVDLAFIKHATSKLSSMDELYAMQTLGFRGEALASISAVARIKLTTKTKNMDSAVCVNVENGKIIDKSYVSANVGTTIEVRNLFYNVPARRNYFKSPSSETLEITRFMAKLILANPNLEISYYADGKKIYDTKGNGLEEAIYSIYGKDCLSKCLRVACSRNNMLLFGYVSSPEFTKHNKLYQTLSINGRCIEDKNISGAIMQAFKPFLMTRQYPFYVLNLEMPCDKVDVNVHPKKAEVRFVKPSEVCSIFYHGLCDVLSEFTREKAQQTMAAERREEQSEQKKYSQEKFDAIAKRIINNERKSVMTDNQTEDVVAVEKSTEEIEKIIDFENFARQMELELTVEKARKNLGLDVSAAAGVGQTSSAVQASSNPHAEETPYIVEESEADRLFLRTRILGAAFKTYLILEIDDKVIFVDQHAAHERILFDKFMAGRSNDMQPVMFPYVFTVRDEEAEFIENNREYILKAGIEVEPFGINTYRISSVSTLLADTKMSDFVSYMLSSVDEFKIDDKELIVEKIAKKACKAAVKAGYSLNEYEIKYILTQVCDNQIIQCPHGRPITVVFTKTQLEKMFKRIV